MNPKWHTSPKWRQYICKRNKETTKIQRSGKRSNLNMVPEIINTSYNNKHVKCRRRKRSKNADKCRA